MYMYMCMCMCMCMCMSRQMLPTGDGNVNTPRTTGDATAIGDRPRLKQPL